MNILVIGGTRFIGAEVVRQLARNHPQWRWTHGYVLNVAAAIMTAALSPAAAGRIYNVGEEHTPTMAERLAKLPASTMPVNTDSKLNFDQNIAYDTSRIRKELGYRELMPEETAMQVLLARSEYSLENTPVQAA